MGRSATGIICFGIPLGEVEFPWTDSADDAEDWWFFTIHGAGFKPSFNPYTEDGEYAEGVTRGDPRIEKFYEERKTHKAQCPPMPFEIIDFGMADYEWNVIAVPGTEKRAYDTHVEFDPSALEVNAEALAAFKAFLKERLEPWFKQEAEQFGDTYEFKSLEPVWLLGSYYG